MKLFLTMDGHAVEMRARMEGPGGKIIARVTGNQLTILDPEAWERFLAIGRDQ